MLDIKIGMTGQVDLLVADEHTATEVGSGAIGVLATPVMINLMEAAALAACESALPQGMQSLGTHINVSHVAATPVAVNVTAVAELVGIDRRRLEFVVTARDEYEEIGSGTHTRVVVDTGKFIERINAKAPR